MGLLGVSGCNKTKVSDRPGAPRNGVGGIGAVVATGTALDLRVTPDGKFGTYLVDAQKPRLDGIPPQMVIGELHLVALAGGESRKLGNGVTNVPGGYLFTGDSRWVLFLGGYNPINQSGELQAFDLQGNSAAKLGSEVSYVLASPDSKRVAFVDGGTLKVGPLPGGPFKAVSGEVSTVQFAPDGKRLFFKRRLSAAGGLFHIALDKDDVPHKLADQVGDYTISADSQEVAFAQRSEVARSTYDLFLASAPSMAPVKLAEGNNGFAFSPDGKWLARTEGGRPELLGDLFLGPAKGGPGRKVGERVQDFSFSPDSKSLAYLELYDVSARAGLLGVVAVVDGKPKRIGDRCPNYTWGVNGNEILFLSRFLKPIYSVDLMLYRMGEDQPTKVNPGVFGYGFTAGNGSAIFRTNCIRNARSCDLFQLDLSQPKATPKKILEGIYSFKSAEKSSRILVSYARLQGDSYDVAVFNPQTGQRKTLDQVVRLPAVFTDAEGSRVAYIVEDRSRPGVYVADQLP